MILRHPGISPTNDLVAKKIFSNPEITCQFIRDMLDLPAKNVTILEGSNIHVLPSLPYSAQDFYTSIDVLAELDNGTQVIIEIQVHHQNFSSIVYGLTCAVRSIKILKKFASKKAILTRATNTSHQYTLLQLWIVIIFKMIWLSTVLACERTRQVRS
ncbi:ribose-phosphate pyrophosphokinase [Streptococcus pseudopneumoniae]|nr:ribose-phosphate pyrophosphokinase [Streptococcus pseudopneumoniae]